MRKAIVSLTLIAALAGTACGRKTTAPATDRHPQAAAATKPQPPAASPQVASKTSPPAPVTSTKKKTTRHAAVAKVTAPARTSAQKSVLSEGYTKDGPG
jgi:hypothetical protein